MKNLLEGPSINVAILIQGNTVSLLFLGIVVVVWYVLCLILVVGYYVFVEDVQVYRSVAVNIKIGMENLVSVENVIIKLVLKLRENLLHQDNYVDYVYNYLKITLLFIF